MNDIIHCDMNSDDKYAMLRLEEQPCFSLYVLSRQVMALYQPLLAPHRLTYPQYLVLLTLWEEGKPTPVGRISERLLLGTSTLTPLLKRMEQDLWIERRRGRKDERVVEISLTERGRAFRETALAIPQALSENLAQGPLSEDQIAQMKQYMDQLIDYYKV